MRPSGFISQHCLFEQKTEVVRMPEGLIVNQEKFEALCDRIREAGLVAFDTEFVSEFTHQPELGLLQFATREESVAVDPYEVNDLASWWEIMADDKTTVVVHGGQAETRFCLACFDRRPKLLVDIQIAEGMRSRSFPLGYSVLVNRVLGRTVHNTETRTDWRRRPLSEQQIHYALEDVEHVLPVWDEQRRSLENLKRLEWANAEFERMIDENENDRKKKSWQRLSGLHKLSPRQFAVACELTDWREAEAVRLNRPARKILRDDLVIELAKRQPKSIGDLMATRDMNRSNYKRMAAEFLKCVERALALPKSELPTPPERSSDGKNHDEQMIGQLLGIALSNRCAEVNISKQLVGTAADLRHLVRWHVYNERPGSAPRISHGWRAEVCGNLLTDVLDGKIALRVADPESDHPLVFERDKSEG